MEYTVDLLIFGIANKDNDNIRELSRKNLSVILVKRNKDPFKDKLVLPGGYVREDETSKEAAQRVLEKETGLRDINLYLSGVNDEVNRDPRNRTISISYIALVDVEKINKELKEDSKWYDIDYCINDDIINIKIDNSIVIRTERKIIDKKSDYEEYNFINNSVLGFDHDIILTKGIVDLRKRVQNTDIIFNLFPKQFTIGALEQVYERILKEKVINSAFRRKFADKLEITDKMVKTGGHRPSYLYRYKESNKKEILKVEEMVDVFDPIKMEKTGVVVEKDTAHKLGIWHNTIHLIILNKDKTKVLFQLRSADKDFYPNVWDITVGGHISAGESDFEAVNRELEEELGITNQKDNIELLTRFKEEFKIGNIENNEIVSLFILYLDVDVKKLKLQKEEVKDVKWITKEELNELIKNKKVLPHIDEYNMLNDILK